MHRRWFSMAIVALLFSMSVETASAASALSRRDGFLLIFRSTSRQVFETREKPYADVPAGAPGSAEITYAKSRELLDSKQTLFYPDAPITPSDALRWIFRTRSVEPLGHDVRRVETVLPDAPDIPLLAEKYHVDYDKEAASMTKDELLALMRTVDNALMTEVHEVSLYSEKFHGKGTAFGETFDMNALTAAHRTFPWNTLVKVTNVDNGKSVTVRINDRGPFVKGRNMDLSLGSFTSIAERSKGKIHATFERLGDAAIVRRCNDDRLQRRITKSTILNPGIPRTFALGKTLSLTSDTPFVIRDMIYPDGVTTGVQTWVTAGESFDMTPSVLGTYAFILGDPFGRRRTMTMEVVECDSEVKSEQ